VLFVVDELTQETQPLILQGVNFATGRSILTEASFSVLNVVAMSLMANPDVRIQIGGHTDATGSLSTNMSLSLGRAEAVRAYLARQGVPLSQMATRGYGPDRPIATNATAAGKAQNRRVELTRMN
jgi:OOP family OmpA-OmpF porin